MRALWCVPTCRLFIPTGELPTWLLFKHAEPLMQKDRGDQCFDVEIWGKVCSPEQIEEHFKNQLRKFWTLTLKTPSCIRNALRRKIYINIKKDVQNSESNGNPKGAKKEFFSQENYDAPKFGFGTLKLSLLSKASFAFLLHCLFYYNMSN